jgi:hypothetical protein
MDTSTQVMGIAEQASQSTQEQFTQEQSTQDTQEPPFQETLHYFEDITVPMVQTIGISNVLPVDLACELLTVCFVRAKLLRATGLEADYFQFFDIEGSAVNDKLCKFEIKMTQEQPEVKTKFTRIYKTDKVFSGRVYVIESWNGTPREKATDDDHYITILLPEEY